MTLPQAGPGRAATLRGMGWMALAGFQFCLLNAVARHLAQDLDPFQTQFLRYLAGLGVLLGSAGHWCLTEAFRIADISATQPVKFIDMIWVAALGWLVVSDVPAATTFAGAAIIFAATTWIARREARRR